jgi:hypothetical protein
LKQRLDEAKNTVQVNSPAKHVVPVQAKKFTYRLADPYFLLWDNKQDRHFPAIEKLSYDNYLVVIKTNKRYEYQFTLLDGADCGSGGSGKNLTSHQIS